MAHMTWIVGEVPCFIDIGAGWRWFAPNQQVDGRAPVSGPYWIKVWDPLWANQTFILFYIVISMYYFEIMAVGEGFEPPEPFGSTVFKTAAFDHSATPPIH